MPWVFSSPGTRLHDHTSAVKESNLVRKKQRGLCEWVCVVTLSMVCMC